LLEDLALKETAHSYELYALIVHQGYSAHKGHYYCFIKAEENPNGGNKNAWYKYDDSNVKLIEDMS